MRRVFEHYLWYFASAIFVSICYFIVLPLIFRTRWTVFNHPATFKYMHHLFTTATVYSMPITPEWKLWFKTIWFLFPNSFVLPPEKANPFSRFIYFLKCLLIIFIHFFSRFRNGVYNLYFQLCLAPGIRISYDVLAQMIVFIKVYEWSQVQQ